MGSVRQKSLETRWKNQQSQVKREIHSLRGDQLAIHLHDASAEHQRRFEAPSVAGDQPEIANL
jgi:hypothetical protein